MHEQVFQKSAISFNKRDKGSIEDRGRLSVDERTRRVGIVGIGGFSLMSMASTIEPLRAANLIAGETLYELNFLSSAASGRSSVGLQIPGAVPLRGAGQQEFIIVVAGGDPFAVTDRSLTEWLREQDLNGATLCGVSGGPVILARAGVMAGYRMTVHWEHREQLIAQFPSLMVSRALYVRDRRRLTCAGGIAPADMMHALISSDHGADFAQKVSDWFLHTDIRSSTRPQRGSVAARFGARDKHVQSAIQFMQDSLGDSFTLEDVARNCNLSKRQLTRRFQDDISTTPMKLAMVLRLETGRDLLGASSLSVTEIAYALDFSSSAHFTTLFRKHFDETPTAARRRLRDS